MNKIVEVLRRERAELAEPGSRPGEWPSAGSGDDPADRRRRIGDIEDLLSEFDRG